MKGETQKERDIVREIINALKLNGGPRKAPCHGLTDLSDGIEVNSFINNIF